jgi:hypothetical protein
MKTMKLTLLFIGLLAWAGVAGLALLMAAWEEPVWGFLPIIAAVFAAWAIGEYVTDAVFVKGEKDA